MKEYIKKIQSKPEHIRKQHLWLYVVSFMIIITGIWVFSLNNRFTPKEENVSGESNNIKPFKVFGETLKNSFKDITASVGSISSKSLNSRKSSEKIIPLITVDN